MNQSTNSRRLYWKRRANFVATAALLASPSAFPAAYAFVPPTNVPLPRTTPVQRTEFPSSGCGAGAVAARASLAAAPGAVDDLYYSNAGSPAPGAGVASPTSAELEAAAKSGSTTVSGAVPGAKITLTRWLSAKVQDYPELRDMESLHLSIQMACKTVSNLIHSASIAPSKNTQSASENDMRDESMKRLDQISKNVLQNALRFTGRLRVVEAPRSAAGGKNAAHQPGVTIAYAMDQYEKDSARAESNLSGGWGKTRRLAACFDPLDGSGNADAAICTGTVFGVFDADAGYQGGDKPDLTNAADLARAVLQPGNKLLAAGYCLYSSTTILVFTLGGGTHGFTLDPSINEFVLTHPNMRIPKRGNIYSCNESYSEGWDDDIKKYLKALKTGTGETGQRYTQRYIGSMVGDVHRTLMYGGILCCPSDTEVHHNGNLQLVYKSAPMAKVLEHAGGKSTDGKVDLLSVNPKEVHDRSPCFMGSPDDMDELMTYLKHDEKA